MFTLLLFRYQTALRKYTVLFRGAHLQFLWYLYQVIARCTPVPQSAYLGCIYQPPLKGNSSEDMMHTGHNPNKHFACNHIRDAATLQLAPVLQRDHGLPQVSPHLPNTTPWSGTTHLPTQLQNISDRTQMNQKSSAGTTTLWPSV